ncbi:ABC transporter substrate-binding protein [Ramlibacter henchirensis]|jgi:branched-chain amino acid transport system substrate-binding protein|uniref:ABC transporter substrate-binding protein n=1 Tax=Ramlibacter henchirensis TaxID=204072 RepID=A0A4Z0BW84_9BURK|nr:ABC transporter substrate-binding protein [Ramlibacter henchirensis]TFZ02744.1 ABC transporter substrate-binding protein [Ramlibacter henchirensis]
MNHLRARAFLLPLAAAACLAAATLAHAADRVKVGFVSTLSGPSSALGVDIRDGFMLAVRLNGGKLGGLPAEVLITDDQFNPDVGRQAFERYVKRDKVDVMTGVVFSNIMLAALPEAVDNNVVYISPNAAPSSIAGKDCNPMFFAASWPNDAYHEAAGAFATQRGLKNAYLIAPNYQAGKDSLAGFKRTFKGQVVGETYTKLGQLDYAAELAEIRAAKPQTLYIFLPGGMGINFIKQFIGSGLSKDTMLLLPGFSADQDVISAVGPAMAGLFNTAHWSPDLDNPANRKFVAEFQKAYNRLPTLYASQGYDTALLIDAAVRDAKGKVEDRQAFRNALRAAKFESVRGPFKFNKNQYPIQNYYVRSIGNDGKGGLVNKSFNEPILRDHGDAYVQQCQMK